MSTCIAVSCILTLDGWRSEAVAVGSLAFVEKFKSELGIKALHRELEQVDGKYALRESGEAYRDQFDSQNEALRPRKHRFMGENSLSCGSLTWSEHLGFETLPPPRRLVPARGQGSGERLLV